MKLLVLLLSAASFASAADWAHKILYGLEIANCIGAAGDAATTYYGVRSGAHETNPLLIGNGQGGLNWPRFVTEKAAVCGIPVVISLVAHHRAAKDRNADLFTLAPTMVLGGYGAWATIHNIGVIRHMQAVPQFAPAR